MSAEDRARLAEELSESLDQEPESEVEAAWDRKIERRVAEVESGTVQLISADEVHAEAQPSDPPVRVVRYHPDARAEFLHEVEYYSRLSIRLSERFDKAVLAAEARAAEEPELWPKYKLNTRRVVDRKFKFSLVYFFNESEVAVVAVAPFRRTAGLLEGCGSATANPSLEPTRSGKVHWPPIAQYRCCSRRPVALASTVGSAQTLGLRGVEPMTIPTEVTNLISGSGNNFHAKVARWLNARGWHIVVSPYYMDQSQNKAREIDLVAERFWPITDSFGRKVDEVAVRLFVECKFVPNHTVFWFTEKTTYSARQLVYSAGIFPENNSYTEKHHYLSSSPKVAKLFATSGSRPPDADPIYKALNQCLNALVSMRGQPVAQEPLRRRPPKVVLEYPVVICSSFESFFGVDFYAEGSPMQLTDNFQLEVRYAYWDASGSRRDEYFLLDFVDFQRLDSFEGLIAEDAQIAAFLNGD